MVVFLVEKLERSKQMFEKDDTGLGLSPGCRRGFVPNARSIGRAEPDLANSLHTRCYAYPLNATLHPG